MARIRTTQYDLTCYGGEYEDLIKALNLMTFSKWTNEKWQCFLMPNGKVKISLTDFRYGKNAKGELEGRVRMIVQRTTFREPIYVQKIIKRLKGEWDKNENSTEKEIIQFYLKENQEEYKETKERYRKRNLDSEKK